MTACPSGVDYRKLIEATRAQIERNYPRSAFEKIYRRMIFATFPLPERLRLLRFPLLVYQKTGLQSLVRATGVLNLFPKKLRAMEALMPRLKSSERIAETTTAQVSKRARVGLLLGCVNASSFHASTPQLFASWQPRDSRWSLPPSSLAAAPSWFMPVKKMARWSWLARRSTSSIVPTSKSSSRMQPVADRT